MTLTMRSHGNDPQFDFVRECVLLGRKWRARVDERLRPTGLTLARATVLYWIDELPADTSQRELADTVGIEGPTLVRQLHALEAQGLVERVAMPGDKRAKGLRLTSDAQRLLDQLDVVTSDLSHELLGKLDGRRVASATKLARDARTALGG